MAILNQTKIEKDPSGKKLIVNRTFNAASAKVWAAWTEGSLLDQWWAPKPYKAETKTMNFTEGGHWLYAMVSPEGEKNWCKTDYKSISPKTNFAGASGFTDEDGNYSGEMPMMYWNVTFKDSGSTTEVHVELTFDTQADLEMIVSMGFKEGFTSALGNLDDLLS